MVIILYKGIWQVTYKYSRIEYLSNNLSRNTSVTVCNTERCRKWEFHTIFTLYFVLSEFLMMNMNHFIMRIKFISILKRQYMSPCQGSERYKDQSQGQMTKEVTKWDPAAPLVTGLKSTLCCRYLGVKQTVLQTITPSFHSNLVPC